MSFPSRPVSNLAVAESDAGSDVTQKTSIISQIPKKTTVDNGFKTLGVNTGLDKDFAREQDPRRRKKNVQAPVAKAQQHHQAFVAAEPRQSLQLPPSPYVDQRQGGKPVLQNVGLDLRINSASSGQQ